MNKKLEFDYDGTHYTLEYNREAIKYMESQGFVLSQFQDKFNTMLDIAFVAAFLKNHKRVNGKLVEEIYSHIHDKVALSQSLIEMYAETYNSMLDDTDATDDTKNIEWKMV